MINKSLLTSFNAFFTKGHERTLRAKKNILASFIIKGLNIAIGLALVPLTINYLDPTRYGIWITLSSIIAWFGFFDIGLGHGLRNRFAEALALGKHELARVYVSTTYAILSLIIGLVLVLFFVINPFLNWNTILNASQDIVINSELSLLALVVFTFFCLSFIFKLITTILTADQRPAKAAFFDLLGKMMALLVIFALTKTTEGSLLYLGIVMSGAPVLVLLISSAWFFGGKYKSYRPAWAYVDFSKAKDLFNLGVKFFVIQLAVVLLYQTNNIIIAQLFGPEQVTPYNVAFKYFSVLMMGFSIVMSPFWSAITEAWAKQEIAWIRNIMRKLFLIWTALLIIGIIMIFASKWVYLMWVGEQVSISFSISILVGAWVLINSWNGLFSNFLNGVGKVKIQLIIGILAAVINLPLALFLGNKIGIEGVLLSNVILALLQSWIYPIQYRKILLHKAQGLWNK